MMPPVEFWCMGPPLVLVIWAALTTLFEDWWERQKGNRVKTAKKKRQ
jgi:hypothetical protein